jgi:hypothetical protein
MKTEIDRINAAPNKRIFLSIIALFKFNIKKEEKSTTHFFPDSINLFRGTKVISL